MLFLSSVNDVVSQTVGERSTQAAAETLEKQTATRATDFSWRITDRVYISIQMTLISQAYLILVSIIT